MNLFQPNLVLWGDRAGIGRYEVGHFLQHDQYLSILAGSGVLLPPWDIRHMQWENENEMETWLNEHEAVHEFLRQHTNVGGVNLSYFDPDSQQQFELWQEAHRAEHAQFDVHFGTT